MNKKFLPFLSVLILFFFSQPELTHGVDPSPGETYFWGMYSQGISTQGHANSIGISVEYNRHVFSVRTTATDSEPFNDTWDIGILYGRSYRSGSLFLSAGAGPSVIAGNQYSKLIGGNLEETMEAMLAFAIEAQAALAFSSFASLGVYTSINVNTNQPIGSIGASIRLGKVK
ncbi:hypothetical protein QLX67_02300 [Balneolaceae bacterium ANBcel3]|nr:hypothetical protein [Balneolaceae bacterium ANBcel3]